MKRDKIYGVGIVGEGKYSAGAGKRNKHTKQYSTWHSMLKRCYNKEEHKVNPSYIGCTVCNEWVNLQSFGEWFDKHYIDGYQLDKDLLIKGNKVYSPETCCFVPQEINLAIIKPMKKRKLPLGVYKNHNKFVTHIKVNKISTYKGIFSTIIEAAECYKREKEKQLAELAIKYNNTISDTTYNALLNYRVDIEN